MNKFYIWATSVVLIVILIFGFWTIYARAHSAENALEASYQRGFYNLQDQVENLEIVLSKALGTSSESLQVMTLTSVWHLAEGAKDSLAVMPLGKQDMMTSQKFFAQLGDYSQQLSRQIVESKNLSDQEYEQLKVFKDLLGSLSQELKSLQPQNIGKIDWESKKEIGMVDNFLDMEDRLKKEAPTITYDGPFSDHVENIKPKGLEGKKLSITEANAQAKSYSKMISPNKYDVKINNKVKGLIPAYNFTLIPRDESSAKIIMDISETGGHLLWFLNLRKVTVEKKGVQEALKTAQEFLSQWDFPKMEATGSIRDGNIVTITFVPKEEDILLYPDYVKVMVALDDGQVLGMDTVEYRKTHVDRHLPPPKITPQEAVKSLQDKLNVSRVRKALIPTPGHKEKLCYEIDASWENERYFIYVDYQTGQEQEILRILETPKGIMTF